MASIYVTRALLPGVLDALARHHDVEVNPDDRRLTRAELIERVAGRDALIVMANDAIDGDILDAAGGRLRIVANHAVGTDNIDLAAATARGVVVTNTPGVLDDATANLTLALILAVSRRIVEGDGWVRAGRFSGGWSPTMLIGLDLRGKTLGIVGLGRIGSDVARKARVFGMEILYAGRTRHPDVERETGARHVDKDTLLREADFVSLHAPLTAETRHTIGARELRLMKATAVLINAGRGPLVDEAALVAALAEHRIWGAGLDVFEDEPALAPGLADLPNAVLTPHIGSATLDTRRAMAETAVRNVIKVLAGEAPDTCVNPDALRR